MNVFQYGNYLDYLSDLLRKHKGNRGLQARLAKAAGTHPSYLSRILHGSTHLTPDQAAGLCDFWHFSRDESAYFLALVNLARAASPKLKALLSRDLEEMQARHNELGEHLPAEKVETTEENIYYSAWFYGAVHVLCTIPAFQRESEIALRLGLSKQEVRRILETLEKLGLMKKNRLGWEPTKSNVHLSNRSWMAATHHLNWRMRVTNRIQFRDPDDLHYTGLHTLSRTDFRKVKEILLKCLVEVDKAVRPSKEEELYCLLLDWAPV